MIVVFRVRINEGRCVIKRFIYNNTKNRRLSSKIAKYRDVHSVVGGSIRLLLARISESTTYLKCGVV